MYHFGAGNFSLQGGLKLFGGRHKFLYAGKTLDRKYVLLWRHIDEICCSIMDLKLLLFLNGLLGALDVSLNAFNSWKRDAMTC